MHDYYRPALGGEASRSLMLEDMLITMPQCAGRLCRFLRDVSALPAVTHHQPMPHSPMGQIRCTPLAIRAIGHPD